MNLSVERLQVLQETLARFERVRDGLVAQGDYNNYQTTGDLCVSLRRMTSASQQNNRVWDADVRAVRDCLQLLQGMLGEADHNYALVYETLLLWAEYYPRNTNNSDDLLDPFTRQPITEPVMTAAGYIFDRSTLDAYYSRASSYELDGYGRVIPRNFYLDLVAPHGINLSRFGRYDIRSLLNQGVVLSKPEALLIAVNRASTFDQIDLTEDLPAMEKKMSRLTIAYYAKKGYELMGNVVGTLAFLALLATAVSFIIPVTLLPLSIIIWSLVACVEATIGMIGRDDEDFLQELALTLASNGILLAGVALILPQLMLALASYSVISAAFAVSIVAIVPALLVLLPIANLLVGFIDICVRESHNFRYEGTYLAFYQRGIALGVYNVCHAVTGSLGAVLGGVLGVAVNCFRPAVSYAEDAVIADFDVPHVVVEELAVENEPAAFSSASSIANGLNVNPDTFINQQVDAGFSSVAINLNGAPVLQPAGYVEVFGSMAAPRNTF